MKTDIDYLPIAKQAELARLVSIIQCAAPAEMIILFGSYARNEWVEDKYDEEHFRYQSDYDILVIVETVSYSAQTKYEREIEIQIEQETKILTPVSVIVHDVEFVNSHLRGAQYFFTDIKKEGVLLYDSGRFQLCEIRELLPTDRKRLAQEYFSYWFSIADEFNINFKSAFQRSSFIIAAFELHQVTERLYSGILLVFTRYKAKTHDLFVLRKLVNTLDYRFNKIFPLDTCENRHLFKLLKKAYIDARYNPEYTVTKEELIKLDQQVQALRQLGELLCREKIESFV